MLILSTLMLEARIVHGSCIENSTFHACSRPEVVINASRYLLCYRDFLNAAKKLYMHAYIFYARARSYTQISTCNLCCLVHPLSHLLAFPMAFYHLEIVGNCVTWDV